MKEWLILMMLLGFLGLCTYWTGWFRGWNKGFDECKKFYEQKCELWLKTGELKGRRETLTYYLRGNEKGKIQ